VVWASAVTVISLPCAKIATVRAASALTIMMLPRMVSVAAGVVTVTGTVLLILPPTKRKMPWLALIVSAPTLLLGS